MQKLKQKHSSDFPGSSFCFLLLLPCKYFEALSREMELIFLRFLEKDILELDQNLVKKFNPKCFTSEIILLKLSVSMEAEVEAKVEADTEADAEAIFRFSWKQK